MFTVLAFTGMRVGELTHLRTEDVEWSDRDKGEGLIHVRVRADWRPKAGRSRSIPIFPPVAEVLKRQRPGKHALSIPSGNTVKERYLLKCLKRAQKTVGMSERGTIHSFRHFFVSWLASQGNVSQSVAMMWIGHGSTAMIQRYFHLPPETAQSIARQLTFETSTRNRDADDEGE